MQIFLSGFFFIIVLQNTPTDAKTAETIKSRLTKKWKKWCSRDISIRIDLASRVAFPGSFMIFCIIYWSYYTSASGYNPELFYDLNSA